MAEQEKYTNPEDEIRYLERQLEEKKRELAQRENPPHEKEIFRGVLKEHIEQARQSHLSASLSDGGSRVFSSLSDDLQKHAQNVASKDDGEEKLRAIIEIALGKTIHDAVKVAMQSSPYLLDELHDHLVDDYYDKLIALRQIKMF